MDLSDELRKLQELQENGTLTPDEFAQAKQAVLARHERETAANRDSQINRDSQQLQRQVERLRLETDLLRIDHQWEVDRENYMIRGKSGLWVPTRLVGIVQGSLFLAFGLLGALFGGSMALAAVAILVPIGLLSAAYTYLKAIAYENAYQEYEQRRQSCIEHQRSRH